jgi:DNA-directed RNA polymerase sigma subunit (sigma70/sigma32)
MTAQRQQTEQNGVLRRFVPCGGHRTTTLETQAARLDEVGQSIRVTKDRVREIQNKALMKLRRLLAEPSQRLTPL